MNISTIKQRFSELGFYRLGKKVDELYLLEDLKYKRSANLAIYELATVVFHSFLGGRNSKKVIDALFEAGKA